MNALSDTALQGRRLLILDDDEQVAATIAATAARLGAEARSVCEPEAFFRLVEQWRPTDILLDLVMPRLDGLEVIARLAAGGCPASLILVSGTGSRVLDAARRAATGSGLAVAGVLPKPFSARRLAMLLEAPPPAEAEAGTPDPTAAGEPAVTATELEAALRDGQIDLFYQPEVTCAGGALVGFEGLARWHHPRRGLLAPARFVPLAEGSELIHPLTDLVLDRGLHWLAGLPPAGSSVTPSLSLNLSARCLEDPALVERVLAACVRHAVAPERLVLEVTETSAMQDTAATLELLTRFRLKGVRLSLDDFGVGYSTLVELARLPFSELKIDKSFVADLGRSEEASKIVVGIVALGHSLGLRITAEGVETAGALDFLRDVGCDVAQGYLIAPPLPPEAAAAWRPPPAASPE